MCFKINKVILSAVIDHLLCTRNYWFQAFHVLFLSVKILRANSEPTYIILKVETGQAIN